MNGKTKLDCEDLAEFELEMAGSKNKVPNRINTDPERVDQGLAKLVLTLIELIRRLLEQQALRRMDHNTLTEEEIERIGNTFIQLEAKMTELKEVFGLKDEDLNIDLGPLGNLM